MVRCEHCTHADPDPAAPIRVFCMLKHRYFFADYKQCNEYSRAEQATL